MYGTGDSETSGTPGLPQWTGTPASVVEGEPLAPVLVAFPPAARQSRFTVGFRWMLAIPQVIVLVVLGIAALLVSIAGWFGALFLGRLPTFAADFLSGYLRWSARVNAYMTLLTDAYPPFTLQDTDYPVRLAIRPGRLNRLAVFFRFILTIPANVVAAVIGYGAFTIVGFVVWLIVLVKGRMPATVQSVWSACLRYQIRLNGYHLMLTSAYPAGLYGDPPTATAVPGWIAPGDTTPGEAAPSETTRSEAVPDATMPTDAITSADAAPSDSVPGDAAADEAVREEAVPSETTPGETTAGYALPGEAAPGYATTAADPASAASPWELVLSGGARNLMTFIVVLGVLLGAGTAAANVLIRHNVLTRAQALSKTRADTQPLNAVLTSYSTKIQACGQQFTCVTALNRTTGAAFSTYASEISGLAMPDGTTRSDAAAVASTANLLAGIFDRLGAATTPAQYEHVTTAAEITQDINNLGQRYASLQLALGARPNS